MGVVDQNLTLYLLLLMVTSDGSGSFCSDTFILYLARRVLDLAINDSIYLVDYLGIQIGATTQCLGCVAKCCFRDWDCGRERCVRFCLALCGTERTHV